MENEWDGWGDRFDAGKGENAERAYFDQQMQ